MWSYLATNRRTLLLGLKLAIARVLLYLVDRFGGTILAAGHKWRSVTA